MSVAFEAPLSIMFFITSICASTSVTVYSGGKCDWDPTTTDHEDTTGEATAHISAALFVLSPRLSTIATRQYSCHGCELY